MTHPRRRSDNAGRRAISRFDTPLDPEDVPEFHAARILLLLYVCGRGPRHSLKGRTKLAKLDFFVRYPRFLERAAAEIQPDRSHEVADVESVEGTMIRYRFGPWDHRYHNILAMLESRALVRVARSAAVNSFELTASGVGAAQQLMLEPAYDTIVRRCTLTNELLGDFTGTQLKNFVYRNFVDEVARLPSESVIRQEAGSDGPTANR